MHEQEKEQVSLAWLDIRCTSAQLQQSVHLDQEMINIGRAPGNEIVVDVSVVSSYHLQIIREKGQYILIHPHPNVRRTLHGLVFQGRSITGEEHLREQLKHDDRFTIRDEKGEVAVLFFFKRKK